MVTTPAGSSTDYASLREEGIRHLERVAGHLWTDFNTHDPGITILEQLCYAITDLGYRASYDLPDLLAEGGADSSAGLFSAARILTSAPVTLADKRRLILDVTGAKNAWIEPVAEPQPLLSHEPGAKEVWIGPPRAASEPIWLRGLYRVQIEKSDFVDIDGSILRREAAQRFLGRRALGEDLDVVRILAPQDVELHAHVEIAPTEDPEGVAAKIFAAVQHYLSPHVEFRTLAEMRATGAPMEEVFNGPPLDHGFVDDATLACLERCSAIHRSDLIHAIMEVEHVRVVRDVRVRVGEKSSQWSLNLDPGSTPRLDYRRSTLGLERAHRPVSLDTHEVVDRFREEQRRAVVRGRLPVAERDLPVPRGRNRNVANYYSIQHQLPATYGVGAAGLAASASPERKARAKQLKAYLTIFDQILANCFAQLARARELLSADGDAEPTYFSQMVADASLGLAEVQRGAPAAHAARLRAITNTVSERSPQRKSRFLSHLMARFAEEFTDHSREGTRPAGAASDRRAVHKKGFLANYPELSGARGVGYDTTDPEPTLCSLEERVRLELGLDLAKDEHVYLVEHILLRPVEEDRPPTDADALRLVPLLSETARVDPYSLQLTFVFPSWPERFTEPHSWKLVGQIVREQTPAHLTPYLRRLDRKAMDAFSSAHGEWRTHRRVYQGGAAETVTSVPTHLALRDARDRLIDLLGIAETYPLRDLSVGSERLTVPFNAVAKIAVKASQVGVTYTLVEQGAALSERIDSAAGTGETLDLSTQPMTADVELEIHARRRSTGRSCFLYQRAVVKVGLDEALDAWIHADLLDPSADTSGHIAARIGDYGARVEVEIADSQEGVDYRLVQTDGRVSEDPTTDVVLSGDTRGDLGNIVLVSQPLHEDTDIRIRAVKTFEASERRPRETVLLTTVLPMKVRANPDIGVGVTDAVVAYGDEAVLRLRRSQQSAAYHVYTRHGGIHLTGVTQIYSSPRAIRGWALQTRRVSPGGRRRRREGPGARLGDKVMVANRSMRDSQLQHTKEHKPAAAGTAAVEAKHELVQVPG